MRLFKVGVGTMSTWEDVHFQKGSINFKSLEIIISTHNLATRSSHKLSRLFQHTRWYSRIAGTILRVTDHLYGSFTFSGARTHRRRSITSATLAHFLLFVHYRSQLPICLFTYAQRESRASIPYIFSIDRKFYVFTNLLIPLRGNSL